MLRHDASSGPSADIDCTTAVQRLWDYLDGELDAKRVAEVEAHLAACRRCPGHFAFAQLLLDQLAAARAQLERPDALQRRVRAALRAEGFGGARE